MSNSLKEQAPLREQAKTTRDIIGEYRLQVDNAHMNYIGLNLAKTITKLGEPEWVPLEAAEAEIQKEHDEVVAYWERVYDKQKRELKNVRQEAIKIIEKAKTERMKELEQEADLNGYSRGKADAEADREDLLRDIHNLLVDLSKQTKKLEVIRKIMQDFPSPETLITHEEDLTEEITQEFYEKLEVDHWLKKLKELLGEASNHKEPEETPQLLVDAGDRAALALDYHIHGH